MDEYKEAHRFACLFPFYLELRTVLWAGLMRQ